MSRIRKIPKSPSKDRKNYFLVDASFLAEKRTLKEICIFDMVIGNEGLCVLEGVRRERRVVPLDIQHEVVQQTVFPQEPQRRRRIEVVQMALDALVGSAVVAVGVAGDTGQSDMRAGQRELREIVIEDHILPVRRIVALRTILRIVSGDVIRIVGGLIVIEMTGNAFRRGAGVLTADVTFRAAYAGVGTGEWESGEIVIDLRAVPGSGGVTDHALSPETN